MPRTSRKVQRTKALEAESPEEDAGEGGEEGEGGPPANVSPEEQAMYNTVVIAAQAIIYGQGLR
jgi:hypothetical protein